MTPWATLQLPCPGLFYYLFVVIMVFWVLFLDFFGGVELQGQRTEARGQGDEWDSWMHGEKFTKNKYKVEEKEERKTTSRAGLGHR